MYRYKAGGHTNHVSLFGGSSELIGSIRVLGCSEDCVVLAKFEQVTVNHEQLGIIPLPTLIQVKRLPWVVDFLTGSNRPSHM